MSKSQDMEQIMILSNCLATPDPVELAQKLIRCPSVTPDSAGSLEVIERELEKLGFRCERMDFGNPEESEVGNLYARLGEDSPHFCFAGHVDVVPAGDLLSWKEGPFEGVIRDGLLHGRGAADMKGAIAAFITAVAGFLGDKKPKQGSISLLITADEEGDAIHGTARVLEVLAARGEKIDFCIAGEPSSMEKLGDTIKIGRRGSLNTILTIHGIQGHVAFPERADNPVSRLIQCLSVIHKGPVEAPSSYFSPSNVEITSVDVGNETVNLIPAQARARFNIRFSDAQTGETLCNWIRDICSRYGGQHSLEFSLSGEAEYVEPNAATEMLALAITQETGRTPQYSTAGGTSDGRFIRHYAPVVEFGLPGQTMHQVNERVSCDDLFALSRIYRRFLEKFLTTGFD